MTHPTPPKRIFPTSMVDARAAEHVPSIPQTESAAYKLAFQDIEFLLREDLRPVRFQLELLKPELFLNEANIGSTFVFYGSARVPAPDMADALVAAATNDEQRTIAERLKAKSPYYDVAREPRKLACHIVIGRLRLQPFGDRALLVIGRGRHQRVGHVRRGHPRRAVEDEGRADVRFVEEELGLQQLQLKADRAQIFAQQELDILKGQLVGGALGLRDRRHVLGGTCVDHRRGKDALGR